MFSANENCLGRYNGRYWIFRRDPHYNSSNRHEMWQAFCCSCKNVWAAIHYLCLVFSIFAFLSLCFFSWNIGWVYLNFLFRLIFISPLVNLLFCVRVTGFHLFHFYLAHMCVLTCMWRYSPPILMMSKSTGWPDIHLEVLLYYVLGTAMMV